MTWLVAMTLALCPTTADLAGLRVEAGRDYRVADLPIRLTVTALDGDDEPLTSFNGCAAVEGLVARVEGHDVPLTTTPRFVGGVVVLDDVVPTADRVTVRSGEVSATWRPDQLRRMPGWLSILPPLFAILLAVMFRQVLLALFAGVWLGAFLVHDYGPLTGLLRCFDSYLPGSLSDGGHAAIVVFTMALGGMVGVISKSGATRALVDVISRRAKTRRSGMVTAWAAGLIIFFDDYANCLLVGNTLRPFTDRLKVSREKLAYIVDSTAAPVATVALVSTWIGYKVGLLDDVFGAGKGYQLFLGMLPYSFYAFFTIAFVFLLAITMRDFGPMRTAELRAYRDGLVLRPGAHPLMDRELTDDEAQAVSPGGSALGAVLTAVVPIVTVVLAVLIGLYLSGRNALGDQAAGAPLRDIVSAADSYAVLLWASFGGGIAAVIMVVAGRRLGLTAAVDAWVAGAKAMVMAVLILVLAWALGSMCKDQLQTGSWILSQVAPSPHLLPLITFLVAGAIALATGSSYGTMAIMVPIAGPMAWQITGDAALSTDVLWAIRHATLAAVMAGAVFGDHCSPISDTTIMSSMSSASDHVDHVRTQFPYAFLCAGIAGLVGFLPAGWGVSPLYTIPAGLALSVGLIFLLGRRIDV